MCTQAVRGRLETEACAPPTLRGGGSKDATRVVERLLIPFTRNAMSIAEEGGSTSTPP